MSTALQGGIRKITAQLRYLAKRNKIKEFKTYVRQEKVLENLKDYSPYCLATTIQSFNQIGVKNDNLWDKLSEYFYQKLDEMSVGDLLMSINAFSQKKSENMDWQALEQIIIQKWPEVLEKEHIIFLPYIFAKNQKGSPVFWEMILRDLPAFIKICKETSMVNNVWAFYLMKIYDKPLWEGITLSISCVNVSLVKIRI